MQGTPASQSMRKTLKTSLASSTPKTSYLWTLVIPKLLCERASKSSSLTVRTRAGQMARIQNLHCSMLPEHQGLEPMQ